MEVDELTLAVEVLKIETPNPSPAVERLRDFAHRNYPAPFDERLHEFLNRWQALIAGSSVVWALLPTLSPTPWEPNDLDIFTLADPEDVCRELRQVFGWTVTYSSGSTYQWCSQVLLAHELRFQGNPRHINVIGFVGPEHADLRAQIAATFDFDGCASFFDGEQITVNSNMPLSRFMCGDWTYNTAGVKAAMTKLGRKQCERSKVLFFYLRVRDRLERYQARGIKLRNFAEVTIALLALQAELYRYPVDRNALE